MANNSNSDNVGNRPPGRAGQAPAQPAEADPRLGTTPAPLPRDEDGEIRREETPQERRARKGIHTDD